MISRVLLIEDDPITIIVVSRLIQKKQLAKEIITCKDGLEALDFFKSQLQEDEGSPTIPELVFLDLNMPIMDGWEFMESFNQNYRKYFPGVKFRILSSSMNPMDEERAKTVPNLSGFISKPLTAAHIELLEEEFGCIS